MRPAARIALIVGTLLTLVNQGSAIISSGVGGSTGMRIAANYAIPYVVSSMGFLASYRVDSDS